MVWYTHVYILFFQVQPLNWPPNRGWNDLNCIKGKHWFSKVISSMFKSDRIGISTSSFPQRRPLFYPNKKLSDFRGHFKYIIVAKTEVRMLFLTNKLYFWNQCNRNPLVWYWHICIFKVYLSTYKGHWWRPKLRPKSGWISLEARGGHFKVYHGGQNWGQNAISDEWKMFFQSVYPRTYSFILIYLHFKVLSFDHQMSLMEAKTEFRMFILEY